MNPVCIVIQTSVSSMREARNLAEAALSSRLAACVQILGPGLSMYRWRSSLEETEEYYLSFKTSARKQEALMNWLIGQHPYDTPEIICRECGASSDYADWLRLETT
ncbi:MAG TPA: divalent-cation tolerance protein CutA [Mariprofundaceae bacterium]|nr:divalent-cation tolerance protein CutA [Mariprofundaceae bacterium]